jgi:hypothetical protein
LFVVLPTSGGAGIATDVLEGVRPQHPAQPADAGISLLQSVISFFPGPINKLILFLNGQISATDVAATIVQPTPVSATGVAVETGSGVATVVTALETVADHFKALHPAIQQYVLQSSLSATITMLTSPEFLKGAAGPRPYQLYQR